MGPLLAGDIQELLVPSVYESLMITDLPPELAFFASLLDAQPAPARDAIPCYLCRLMIETDKACLVEAVPGEASEVCVFETVAGNRFVRLRVARATDARLQARWADRLFASLLHLRLKGEPKMIKKLSYVLCLLMISVAAMILTLTIMGDSPQIAEAAPPGDGPPQFHEIYQMLEDGSIVVTRTQLASESIIQATQVCTKAPPHLSEPVDGAQLDNLVPDYKFFVISDTFEYYLEASAYETFSETIRSVTVIVSNPISGELHSLGSLDNLSPNTIYYWHVASKCEDEEIGTYSPAWSFRSGPPGGTILPAPTLLAPDDHAPVGSIRVTLAAEEVSNAERYQFRFYHSEPVDWSGWFRSIMTYHSTPMVQSTFDPQETYYWRAAARNNYAWGNPSGSRSFTTPPVTATTTISPDAGATLTPDPGNISIQFPPGAVVGTTTLSYTLQPYPDQDLANFRFAGRAFTLKAFDTNGQPITTFNQPFTITIVYDGLDLIAAGIGNPSRLNLAFWDGSRWVEILPCTGCSVDTQNQTITVVIDHLTEFALLAPVERSVHLPVVLRQ
jgi:hypothetical protein